MARDTEKLQAMRCLVHIDKGPTFYDRWVKIHAKPGEWTEEMRFLNGTTGRSRWRVYRGRLQEWVED